MKFTKRPTALTIAGLDPSGGAGLIADIKTFLANGVYGMGAVTCVTAQNTVKVSSVNPVDPSVLEDEIMTAIEDIEPQAVKIGMIGNTALIQVVSECMEHLSCPIILDPIMISSSGTPLLEKEAISALEKMIPQVSLLTPNFPEALYLADIQEPDKACQQNTSPMTPEDGAVSPSCISPSELAMVIGEKYHTNILVKGGHLSTPDDYMYLFDEKKTVRFPGLHIDNPNTHGTGCTLSSAIASNLAKGSDLIESVRLAKEYVTTIISAGLDLGHGSGPMDHGAVLRGDFTNQTGDGSLSD